MRNLLTIWHRELQAGFLSPIAYVTIALFLALSGWTFVYGVESKSGSEEPLAAILFVSIGIWLPILVTVVCMRLFAEERRSGNLETLLSAPVGDWSVVLGKYAGAMTLLLAAMLPAVGMVAVLQVASPGIERVAVGSVAGGTVLLVLILAMCTAIGLLMSLLTSNQIVAAIACFTAVCAPFLVEPAGRLLPLMADDILHHVSIEQHLMTSIRGVIPVWMIWLYGSVTAFFLFTAVRVLESRRWLG